MGNAEGNSGSQDAPREAYQDGRAVMSDVMTPIELPFEADYEEVSDKLQAAHDALEAITWRLEPLNRVATPNADVPGTARPVTAADLGWLWSFLDGVELQLSQLRENRELLLPILGRLDELRLEAGRV